MIRAQQSQLKEILLQLAEVERRLEAIHWEVGEGIPVEKSLMIGRAVSSLKDAIKNLTGGI